NSIEILYRAPSTSNSQLPTPKENRSNNAATDIQRACWYASTSLFERLPLGVGSWELGVVRCLRQTPAPAPHPKSHWPARSCSVGSDSPRACRETGRARGPPACP